MHLFFTDSAFLCFETVDLISSVEYGTPDSALTSSSEYENNGIVYAAKRSRINTRSNPWCAHDRPRQWLQAGFSENRNVFGIQTRNWLENRVEQYLISISNDGNAWQTIKAENGDDFVFVGNSAPDNIVINMLPEPVVTRFVRLTVLVYNNLPSVRWAIIGCPL